MATTLLNPVRVATDGNVILNAAPAIIDGITLANNDRVLVKSQNTLSENGIYVYNSSTSSLSRSLDFASGMTSSTLESAIVFVKEGDKYGETGWIVATDTFTVGSTSLEFIRFSVNTKESNDVESSITYRFDKGYPLTNLELDNNFKFLASELDSRVRSVDYTAAVITSKLNAPGQTAAINSINAYLLRDLAPATTNSPNSIVSRDSSGNFAANTISANLNGNALTATTAATATTANSLTGYVVPLSQGGTESTTASQALTTLGAVARDGTTAMTGRLVLAQSGAAASLRITPSLSTPSSIQSGDVWFFNGEIYYRDASSVTQKIAKLDSPTFTGSPALTNTPSDIDLTKIANVNYVNNKVNSLLQTVLQAIYPLGSIYINATNSTNPSTLLGFGTWVAFGAGRVPVGFDTTNSLFNSSEKIGGSANSSVVSHSHTASSNLTGTHSHAYDDAYFAEIGAGNLGIVGSGRTDSDNNYYYRSPTPITATSGAHSHSITVDSTGTSGTNANYQPFITVYMWKRTA